MEIVLVRESVRLDVGGLGMIAVPSAAAPMSNSRGWRDRAALLFATMAFLALGNGAQAGSGALSVELNKLESQDHGCRAYVVVTNKSTTTYQVLKLDLVLFQPDGVIGRRFAIDLGPLKSDKRTVKLFDIDATSCDQVRSFLINDVLECKADSGPIPHCLAQIATSSLTEAQFTK
jgi:hypothetical protein